MPKVIINKDDLPPISSDDEGYNVRVRLISQDRNRSSYWTPLYTVTAPEVTEIPYNVHVVNAGGTKTVNIVWEDPKSDREYDIYVKWYMTPSDPGAIWVYKGSTFSNTYVLIDPGAHSFQVSVQKVTYPKAYIQRYSLFTSPVDNL